MTFFSQIGCNTSTGETLIKTIVRTVLLEIEKEKMYNIRGINMFGNREYV